MIVSQLPSLQQIYDYSSSDLQSIIKQVQLKIDSLQSHNQQKKQFQNYIENIKTELQERKTLQFFQELCLADNPYIQKVTNFNQEFLKLASQVIQQKQKQQKKQKYQALTQSKKSLDIINEQKYTKNNQVNQNDQISVTSNQDCRSNYTQQYNAVTEHQFNPSSTSITSKEQFAKTKKMGLIMKKKKNNKNSMMQSILNNLNKNKVQNCVVMKVPGQINKKPAYVVNQRGHLVHPATLQPLSSKSIKSTSQNKPQPIKQLKEVTQKSRTIDKQFQKKKLEVLQKVKDRKVQKKQKYLSNKDLVQMIRKQQKQKQKKQQIKKESIIIKIQQKPNQKYQQNNNDIIEEKILVNNQKIQQKNKHKINGYAIIKSEQQIIEEVIKKQNDYSIDEHEYRTTKLQEIKEQINQQQSIVITKNDKNKIKFEGQSLSFKKQQIGIQQQNKNQQNIQKTIINQQKPIKQINIIQNNKPKQQFKIPQQSQYLKQSKQQKQQKQQKINNKIINIYNQQMQQLLKINTQLQQQRKKIQIISQNISNNQLIQNVQKQIIKQPQFYQPIQSKSSPKKIYNQQYWIHVRQQAQFKIKRFKQQKQLEQMQRNKIKQNITKSLNVQNKQSSKISTQQEIKQEPSQNQIASQFIQTRTKQLKKMMDQHNKRKIQKKSAVSIAAPSRPLYQLPQFNYLQIYPTFNHIFSIMYTKAQHQALNDIPSVMKQISNMFSTHIAHFKDKSSIFQPAMFMPFDNTSLNCHDPRQLLLHAENTYVNLKKIVQRLQIFNSNIQGQFQSQDQKYYRVIKTKQQVYDIITTGMLRKKGWKELPHGCSLRSTWNLFWSWSKPDIDISKLLVWQRINHFPFNKNLSRKDLLYKNIDSFRKMLKIQFNFLPLTFNLPKQYTQFSMKFHQQEMLNRDLNYWIMKPIGKSRGRGIKVISNLAQLNYTDNIVVQKYITNPLLLDGYKFDMRIYVLVTNFHPLQAFVYKQGFARLSTQKFSLEPMFIKNTFVHLTNFAVNKNNEEAKKSAAFSGGSKISLKVLKQKLAKMNYSFNSIWSQVHEIIIKSLIGCSISVPSFPTAFQLFGYDIMIDDLGNCHLIEINASPSLERSYMIDEIIKQSLIDDILDIVDPPFIDKEQLLDVISDRLGNKKKISPEEDLIAIARILRYKKIRKIGEIPENIGLFEMIAPSKMSQDLQKIIKGRSGANNPRNID